MKTEQEELWIQEIWDKIEQKMEKTVVRAKNKIPYTAVDGVFDDCGMSRISWWTNGFWPGLLWMLYEVTGNATYMETAVGAEELLDGAFERYDELHHDVGFMWFLSSGAHYRITKDPKARLRTLYAANLLAGRFQVKGGYLRAWNDGIEGERNQGWTIIDCMMNLPLLYWASGEVGDDRYASIAGIHADKTMEHHVRPDGSVRHIVEYDPQTGAFVREHGGQGYGVGSSWSRGQAWGLYGFTQSYRYTGEESYLNTAKKIAQYVIACTREDWLPRCDFRSPSQPVIYDSTAGAIAASGLLDLAECVPPFEQALYRDSAVSLLRALTERFCDWNPEMDGILTMGTERYHSERGRHIPIIYGDYYLVEAFAKLLRNM